MRAAPRLPRLVQETLNAFLVELRRRFGDRVAEVRLFGSYARGEAREQSDVDVLVLLAREACEDERAITDLAADLVWTLHGVVISPMVLSVAEFERWKARERRTVLDIEREGIVL
jgi:predicted nucleotidyltransferase